MPGHLRFPDHARREMAADAIPEAAVYHVVGDADEVIERADGRTEYVGTWEGRRIAAIVEDDGETVVTVWEWKQRRRRR
jgi:hypothetical protein